MQMGRLIPREASILEVNKWEREKRTQVSLSFAVGFVSWGFPLSILVSYHGSLVGTLIGSFLPGFEYFVLLPDPCM